MFLVFLEKKLWTSRTFNFPTPLSLNIWWNIGFLIILVVFIQVITGVLLSCLVDIGVSCLTSKLYVFKEVSLGWLLIILHSILPSLIFYFIYLHIFKNLLFPVYSVFKLWISGVSLLVIFIVIVFTGYSLVGSSMSYWAIIVIGELITFVFGRDFSSILLFFEGVGVSNPVFYKLFTIHYIFSIVVLLIICTHIYYLHKFGSSSLGFNYCDRGSFSTILFLKDSYIGLLLMGLISYIIFFIPEAFISGDGMVPIDRKDSVDISVEWYLRVFFILLRSLNNKFLGVVLMLFLILLILFNLFFKSLWGLRESFISLLLFLISTLLILVSFYFFSSSIYSISILLILLSNLFVESILIIFFFYRYLPLQNKY